MSRRSAVIVYLSVVSIAVSGCLTPTVAAAADLNRTVGGSRRTSSLPTTTASADGRSVLSAAVRTRTDGSAVDLAVAGPRRPEVGCADDARTTAAAAASTMLVVRRSTRYKIDVDSDVSRLREIHVRHSVQVWSLLRRPYRQVCGLIQREHFD